MDADRCRVQRPRPCLLVENAAVGMTERELGALRRGGLREARRRDGDPLHRGHRDGRTSSRAFRRSIIPPAACSKAT